VPVIMDSVVMVTAVKTITNVTSIISVMPTRHVLTSQVLTPAHATMVSAVMATRASTWTNVRTEVITALTTVAAQTLLVVSNVPVMMAFLVMVLLVPATSVVTATHAMPTRIAKIQLEDTSVLVDKDIQATDSHAMMSTNVQAVI
jgi:hypothetical protein